jgi:hypothetical protein
MERRLQFTGTRKSAFSPFILFHMQHFMKSNLFHIKTKFKFLFLFKRKQLLPIDQRAHPQDFQQRFDNEFLQVK